MDYRMLVNALTPRVGAGEARAIARLVMDECFGLSQTDLLLGRDSQLSSAEHDRLAQIASRLVAGEPVQYVLGSCTFCGHRLRVTPDVLIPRPETEELVVWVLAGGEAVASTGHAPTIVDLCTGSGAIAIAVAASLPSARVVAADISAPALSIARENAASVGVSVDFMQLDVLDTAAAIAALPQADIIVSNPPYVRASEAMTMDANVLEHEPHLALFVPDDDALRFYRAIAQIAGGRLTAGGAVYVEINSNLAASTAQLFREHGFGRVELRQDQFGRDRMLRIYR